MIKKWLPSKFADIISIVFKVNPSKTLTTALVRDCQNCLDSTLISHYNRPFSLSLLNKDQHAKQRSACCMIMLSIVCYLAVNFLKSSLKMVNGFVQIERWLVGIFKIFSVVLVTGKRLYS
jgi:hypothetical protein